MPADPPPTSGPRPDRPHVPVLLDEVVAAVMPADGDTIIDGTFGAGGYATALLRAANCSVLALDRDLSAVRAAMPVCVEFPGRLTVVEACFGDLDAVARAYLSTDMTPAQPSVFTQPAAVVLDIGVSSMQLDQPERGFSFQTDGPLDMRMSASGRSAADIVNSEPEAELADIIYRFGEERRSRAIARAIVARRLERPFTRTLELAELVQRALKTPRIDGRHAATRTFQALRIATNDELGELARGLAAAERILKPGGRLVVVAFHSLEDAIVKRFLKERAGRLAQGSRHLPRPSEPSRSPSFELINRQPITASSEEIARNPRARSARLRAALRTVAPAWPPN